MRENKRAGGGSVRESMDLDTIATCSIYIQDSNTEDTECKLSMYECPKYYVYHRFC